MENKSCYRTLLIAVGMLSLLLFSSGALVAQENEEVFELSPFEVDASQDTGYRAINTLAGSRLNTNLGDVGSSISVLTKEFMDDLGVTDINNALIYTANTEAAGEFGNVSDTIIGAETNAARSNPENAQRVRGLASATRTRNFFSTDIPTDAYNIGRLTISRGPNALLFGIGSPGGVIDSSLATASRSDTFTELQVRLGEHGGNRTILKHNQVLLEGRLGVYFAGLRQRHEYQQRPAFEDSDRYYIAFEALLHEGGDGALGNTILRGNFEDGHIESERPQSVMHNNSIPWWFDARDPAKYSAYGATLPDSLAPGNFVSKFIYDWENVPEGGRPTHITRAQGFSPHVAQSFDIDGSPAPYYPGTAGIEGNIRGTDPETGDPVVWDHFQVREWRPPSPFKIRTGRTTPYSIWDNRKRLLVPGGFLSTQDFDSYNLTLEQTFFDGDLGFEIAVDEQRYDTKNQSAGTNDFIGWLTVDVNAKLADGSPNPNVGRPMIRSHVANEGSNFGDRESDRVTAYYQLDFTDRDDFWANMGVHRFTGFLSEQTHENRNEIRFSTWDTPDAARIWPGQEGSLLSWVRRVNFNHYVGPDLRGVANYEDIRLTGGRNPGFITENSQPINVRVWDDVNQGLFDAELTPRLFIGRGGIERTIVDSEVFAWQGNWFDNHVVTLFGIRDDESKTFGTTLTRRPDGSVDPSTTFTLNPDPSLTAQGDTETKSVVVRIPENWNPISEFAGVSLHWAESENFSPTSLRKDLLGEQLAPQSGVTEEMGISFELLDNRLMARFNWFETSLTGDTAAGRGATNDFFRVAGSGVLQRFVDAEEEGIPFGELWSYASQDLPNLPNYTSYADVYAAVANILDSPTKEILGLRVENGTVVQNDIDSQNISDTRDVDSEGFEFELIGSLTQNWTVAFNAARQEAIRSNVIPLFSQVFFNAGDRMEELGLLDLYTDWGPDQRTQSEMAIKTAFIDQLTSKVLTPLQLEGQLSPEVREWRYNLVTNYNFSDDTKLKGFGIGAAGRWQDEIAIGYDSSFNSETGLWEPIISRPYLGPSEFNMDMWITYRTKIFDGKVDWKVQLNARNVFGDTDAIPFQADVDGTIMALRNPPPQEFFLTNTFSFLSLFVVCSSQPLCSKPAIERWRAFRLKQLTVTL